MRSALARMAPSSFSRLLRYARIQRLPAGNFFVLCPDRCVQVVQLRLYPLPFLRGPDFHLLRVCFSQQRFSPFSQLLDSRLRPAAQLSGRPAGLCRRGLFLLRSLLCPFELRICRRLLRKLSRSGMVHGAADRAGHPLLQPPGQDTGLFVEIGAVHRVIARLQFPGGAAFLPVRLLHPLQPVLEQPHFTEGVFQLQDVFHGLIQFGFPLLQHQLICFGGTKPFQCFLPGCELVPAPIQKLALPGDEVPAAQDALVQTLAV